MSLRNAIVFSLGILGCVGQSVVAAPAASPSAEVRSAATDAEAPLPDRASTAPSLSVPAALAPLFFAEFPSNSLFSQVSAPSDADLPPTDATAERDAPSAADSSEESDADASPFEDTAPTDTSTAAVEGTAASDARVTNTVPARVCVPSARVCVDGTQWRACNAAGTEEETGACGARERCVLETGACAAWACTPGVATCTAAGAVRTCALDGSGTTEAPCAARSRCAEGACISWVCTPGASRCSVAGDAQETCRADGSGWAMAACPTVTNGTGFCVAGRCTARCADGWADCDGVSTNGCETDVRSDVAHCGACNFACAPPVGGRATCAAGVCAEVCAAGFFLCDGACAEDAAREDDCDGLDDDCDGTVDEGCAGAASTCETPTEVPAAGGHYTGVLNGTGIHSAPCGAALNSRGGERVWRWVPARSGTARARLTGDFWPATLYVRGGTCTPGASLACDSQTATWPTEVVTWTVTAGVPYWIFVDGSYNGTAYSPHYDLVIAAP